MCVCLHVNPVLCKAKRYGYSVDDSPIEPCKCTCHGHIALATELHKDHGCAGSLSFDTCTAEICVSANALIKRISDNEKEPQEFGTGGWMSAR